MQIIMSSSLNSLQTSIKQILTECLASMRFCNIEFQKKNYRKMAKDLKIKFKKKIVAFFRHISEH